ncbi:Mitochondrial dicarboxylate carrier isoform 2 [Schistosoma japonicum]|uniref:Mitochondrial dicarboxylate carrier isoform 2 n=1 Tax=Schistosoma japonicum TaxID=6182 RepID=A0A4Z2DJA2_SCHJA|nr:Mitochondrial dicarboxylate carrier [Schistosoma japonicum]TNN16457.1 Mitochondrial dicarboxylate carrier isoform 2 [Schistosoma japonicum]
MSVIANSPKKVGSWYFGGVASAMAAACTHPLDLIKVHLQTQQKKEFGMVSMGIRVCRRDGISALYNGISASILRQLTYSMTRFGMYETYKQSKNSPLPFSESALVAMISGFCGGVVGNPADVINVRMQNDMKLSINERRNYKHCIDGLIQVVRHEGVVTLFNGVSMTASRAAFMTLGQLAFYDKFKIMLINTSVFDDKPVTHMIASSSAAAVATFITQPFDVMKTRLMNAPPGKYSGLMSCAADLALNGPFSFFKGLIPAFIRLAPHTVLTFVFLEQLTINFGHFPPSK